MSFVDRYRDAGLAYNPFRAPGAAGELSPSAFVDRGLGFRDRSIT